MKLASYLDVTGGHTFGTIVGDRAVPFSELGEGVGGERGAEGSHLDDAMAYLRALPQSRTDAQALSVEAADRTDVGSALDRVTMLAPVPTPAAILDCGLTPRHLGNSAATLLRSSAPRLVGRLAAAVARRAAGRPSDRVRYYKGNCQSVSGDRDEIPWPPYTHYLDIEPELALVTGAIPIGSSRSQVDESIAGYTIFNDVSARDVQLPEMFFTGPATSKDLDRGNGLGPWLVTPDELGDPLAQEVSVLVNGRARWKGNTNEYAMHPVDVVVSIAERQSLSPGTVIGFGTVPDTCGLDHGDWLDPGDKVEITISGIGTLHQELDVPAAPPNTPWARRSAPGLR